MTQSASDGRGGAPAHWITTGALLGLTALMLGVAATGLPRSVHVGLLLAAMLAQVALIAAQSMHLRRAHPGLVWTFVAGLLITGLLLYVLIAPDALRIHEMAGPR